MMRASIPYGEGHVPVKSAAGRPVDLDRAQWPVMAALYENDGYAEKCGRRDSNPG
jgi:hypothetical protein